MRFSKILTYWYSIHKRALPWRATKNPYHIWLSEIILQQTQIKQGLPYYHSFIEHFPTVFELASANEQEVLKLWQGLGYYSRARNLHATAKYVDHELDGKFPETYLELLKLKGVGDYTASAIASFCFNEPAAVVDGNVYRVLARYFGIFTPINSSKGQKEFKAIASDIIDTQNPAEHNQALMEFGSLQCKPSNPDCSICVFNESCVAFRSNSVSDLPVKLKKNKVRIRHFNYLIKLDEDEKIIFEKRKQKGIWQNMYQFPLIESNEELDEETLRKQINSTQNLKIDDLSITLFNEKDVIHKLSHQHLHTKFWILEQQGDNIEDFDFSEIKKYPTPMLISNFVNEFEAKY
ncbi:A/G-specific DNA-adenine glycosylase [Flavobacteriaceae bacterium MAR_2010_188]|nr:A/G-specific DNA-adenine glycosylase [Flavobacteriaceae bacterium MAR_2010_188]